MNEITNRLVNHLLLWHCTLSENAETIEREGFRPGKKPGMPRNRPIHFFQSAIPFLDMATAVDQANYDGLLCAVKKDRYNLGDDYAHQMTDVFIFHVPLPPDIIVARFSVTNIRTKEDLKRVLSKQLQCDVSSTFSDICLNEAIPWSHITAIASTLRALDEDTYHKRAVTKRLLREEIGEVDEQNSERLFSLLVESNQAFHRRFLDLYYGEYPFPHFARALMVAGARFVHPVQVLALHAPTVGSSVRSAPSKHQDDASVCALLAEILPRLSRKESVFGAIEMAAMRKFPGDEKDLTVIENWIAQQAERSEIPRIGRQLAEEAAFYFIRFGGDSFPSRRGEPAVRMAVAALRGTGVDYFEYLLSLAETHGGLIQVFGFLEEKRAIPYLSSCLKHESKGVRAAAVEALGRIGTEEAINLVKQAANDKAKNVQRAVESVLRQRL